MSIREKAIAAANWWAIPDPYRVTADDLTTIFQGAGCDQLPTAHDFARTFGPKSFLSDGCYVGGQAKQWCGIFATMVLKTSGANIKWSLMTGSIVGSDVKAKMSKDPIQPGDVAYIEAHQHHFLVVGLDGKDILTVEGNAGNQRIMSRRRSSVAGHYSFNCPAL